MQIKRQIKEHKTQLLILMVLLMFVAQASTDIFIPGLPSMTREFNTDLAKMNTTISIFVYSQAIFFLVVGVISDLYGRRVVLISCVTVQIIASILIANIHSLNLFIILRIFQALGTSAVYIVLRMIIKDIMDREEQVHAIGILVIGMFISPAVAPVVGAHLIDFFDWRACFVAVAISMSILLIWFWVLVDETNLHMQQFRHDYSLAKQIRSYFLVMNSRLFNMLVLIVGGTFSSYYGFIAISSYVYIDEYKINSVVYSYVFLFIAGGYLLGNQIMLRLNSHKVPQWKIIQYGLIISCIGMIVMLLGLFMGEHKLLILGMLTFGASLIRLATAFINPPVQALVVNHFGHMGAQALGLISCFQYLSAGIGAAIVSHLPFAPSVSLILGSIIFTLISLIGYYYCPSTKIKN